MRPTTRLVLNTGSTYLRMALTVGMGLLALRWANRALGDDFAVWMSLVAAVGVLLVISESAGSAVERFLAFEIGRGESGRQREFFATALGAMIVVALLVLAAGWPLGRWVIEWALQDGGRHAALRSAEGVGAGAGGGGLDGVERAYGLVLLGQCATVVGLPFRSLFVARQSAAWLTLVDALEALLRLLAVAGAIAMQRRGGDGLSWVCGLTAAAQGGVALATAGLCMRAFPESRGGVAGCSRAALRELAGFTGWSALGVVSYRLRMSGMPMLLLRGFGSAAMAPWGLASTLAGYQTNLSSAIGRAAQPAIAQAAGAHEGSAGAAVVTGTPASAVVRLIPAVNRLSTLAAMCFLVPMSIETEQVLRLWLGEGSGGAPAFAAETPLFVRLMLVLAALPWMYMGYHAAIMADGRIRGYMVSALLFEVVGLAVSAWLVLGLGAPAWSVLAVAIGTAACATTFWVWWICGLLGLRVRTWLSGSWLPVLAVVGLGAFAAMLPAWWMEPGMPRLCAVTGAYLAVALPATWWIGMTAEERGHLSRLAGRLRSR